MLNDLQVSKQKVQQEKYMEEFSLDITLNNIEKAMNNYKRIIEILLKYKAIRFRDFDLQYQKKIKAYLKGRYIQRLDGNIPVIIRKNILSLVDNN